MRKHETITDNSQSSRARRKFIMTDVRLSPPSPRRHSPVHTEPKPRAVKKFIMTDVRLTPPSPRQHSPSKPRRNFVMTDIELPQLPPQYQQRAHKEPKPRATKKFIMTDYRLSPPSPRQPRQRSPSRPHSPPRPSRPHSPSKPRRNFIMTDIELPRQPQQQQPSKPRQRRNFTMTDIELPPPLTRPRRIRKRIVKTYKLNKQLSYKRGLHILKKISE